MPVIAPFSAFIRPALLGAASLLLGLAASCTYSHGEPEPTCTASTQTITYASVISPIFDANCRECHASTVANTLGGGNDFSTYQSLKNYPSATILGCIKHTAGYPEMPQGKPKLSDCDIERIQRWIDEGRPQ
ncbi:c-type cytochrome [Hymenobacter rubidus]|uniref:c-type cytochrome n=1 Tax=Hymenobacter rubidus TaxID=1441626 RepID=UPI00191E9E90|nr:cytochrome c [Hymenobacter rubidus]